MPTIGNPSIYNAVNKIATKYFQTRRNFLDLPQVPRGEPLYRYTNYRGALPQEDPSGRTVWGELASDTGNRWTGVGTDTKTGSRGLYTTGEFYAGSRTPFPEAEHYMQEQRVRESGQPDNNTEADVSWFEYDGGVMIERSERRTNLRSMFLYSTTEEFSRLNLKHDSPVVHEIFQEVTKDHSQLLKGQSLEQLYFSPDDASFARAIGNAAFANTEVASFETTSARDLAEKRSTNTIIRGEGNRPVKFLRAEGRGTFFIDPQTNVGQGVFTVDDMKYNITFERPGQEHLPPRAQQADELGRIATGIADKMADSYDHAISLNAPSERTERVGTQIEEVQKLLAGGQVEDAQTQMQTLSENIEQLRVDGSLLAHESAALVDAARTLEALSSITNTVKAAREEAASGEEEQAREEEQSREEQELSEATPEEILPREGVD